MNPEKELIVVGGGLAGCEAAWQAAKRGIKVKLFEMRPKFKTPAHKTSYLAEIICSNSFGSFEKNKASGLLMFEMRKLGSLLLNCAEKAMLPAGHALAVDRDFFSGLVQNQLENHPLIEIIRDEVTEIPSPPAILASGPLTSNYLSLAIQNFTGQENLFFFDAIAPIVATDSIDMRKVFRGSRYDRSENDDGDYLNCPMSSDQYNLFIKELIAADQIQIKNFESTSLNTSKESKKNFFEGCMPIEEMARRGHQTLLFGPLRPVGIKDPRTNTRPFAVVQLRQDDLNSNYFNLVGFQTNLTYSEQRRVFRLIPGLENAQFARFGQMHRNTFINSPILINPTLESRIQKGLFFAGQLSGIEGYLGSIATGAIAGINSARLIKNEKLIVLPKTTLLGALCDYISTPKKDSFQPMKANFGLLPLLKIKNKKIRRNSYAKRSLVDLELCLSQNEL